MQLLYFNILVHSLEFFIVAAYTTSGFVKLRELSKKYRNGS